MDPDDQCGRSIGSSRWATQMNIIGEIERAEKYKQRTIFKRK